MSHVTDIILSTSGIEKLDSVYACEWPSVDELSKYLNDKHAGNVLVRVDDQIISGRVMQCNLFIAAINHLNIPEFLEAFHRVDWYGPEYVQLMLKDEHDERFTTYVPKI